MKGLLKILPRGRNMLPLLLGGLLTVYTVFRAKKNISGMEYDLLIQRILTGEGYSPRMARFFAAVSRHETGNYSSAVLDKFKNLFGMKFPHIRFTYATSEDPNGGYAVYSAPDNSVRDLAVYLRTLDYPRDIDSARDLVTLMKKKKYFEADFSEYLNGVENALPKVFFV